MNSNISAEISEDAYLNEISVPIVKNNYVVISGCSGGGKSSLLSELAKRGYQVVLEPGRQIVKEQSVIEGDALPWVNLEKFLELALSRYLFQFNSQKETEQFIFFDRGIVDSVQFAHPQPDYFQRAAENFRYNCLVFLVPPWEEIFSKDTERQHGFEAAKEEFEELLIKYKHFGYETVLVPKVSVKERADFILEKLNARAQCGDKKNVFIARAKQLLEWNKNKLTAHSKLVIEDLKDLFAPEFVVIANGRKYDANYKNYLEFLNQFRSDIKAIDYQVQEYFSSGSTVIMPLIATVRRLQDKIDIFDAILFVTFNEFGKIVHWQEVYALR